jgi:predicted dienelactone hydrolase
MEKRICRLLGLALLVLLAAGQVSAVGPAYDPLAVSAKPRSAPVDLAVHDEARNREIPLRVYLPAETAPAPVVLFSPGLGGSREGYAYLGTHWASRGYAVVVLQHPGSDDAVWRDKPPGQRLIALQQAVSLENFLLRAKDVPAVLDQLEGWNATAGHPLAGRLDGKRIGMAGHSFGAVTTEAVSGQVALGGTVSWTDPRIRAAVALSPSPPRRGDAGQAFRQVKIPWMLMTGTKDVAPIGDVSLESRLAVFPALPPGGKYELVLDGAEHSAFSDRPLPGDTAPRNPEHHRAILALSTAFWDAWLREDAAAKAWLDGDGPASVLDKKDRWQKK